jgi:hypothetical protein
MDTSDNSSGINDGNVKDDVLIARDKIKNSPSKTWPFLIFWVLIMPVSIVVETMFNKGLDLQSIILITAGCSFAYMGFEYVSEFIKNKSLDSSGIAKIDNIERYKFIIIIWITYTILSLIGSYFWLINIEITNKIAIFTGSLTAEYISGNKITKSAISSNKELK